jgi:hypothetical protein
MSEEDSDGVTMFPLLKAYTRIRLALENGAVPAQDQT